MANEGYIIFKNRSKPPSRKAKTLGEIFLERAEKRTEYQQFKAGQSLTRDEKAMAAIDHMTRDEADTQRKCGAFPNQDAIRKEMQTVGEIAEKKRDLTKKS